MPNRTSKHKKAKKNTAPKTEYRWSVVAYQNKPEPGDRTIDLRVYLHIVNMSPKEARAAYNNPRERCVGVQGFDGSYLEKMRGVVEGRPVDEVMKAMANATYAVAERVVTREWRRSIYGDGD